MPFVIHSSFVWGFLLAPALFYAWYRDRSEPLRREAARAFDFQVAVYVIFGGASLLSFWVLVVWLHLKMLWLGCYVVAYLWVWWLALRGVVRAWKGNDVGYPEPFRLLGRLRQGEGA